METAEKRKKVLIVSPDRDLGILYRSFLDSNIYVSLVCTYEEGPFETVVKFRPHLAIIFLDWGHDRNDLDFLMQIRQVYNEDEHLLILLVVPKDWNDPRLATIADEVTMFPVDPEYLRQRTEYLLQKYHSK